MNKAQKEVQKSLLSSEKDALDNIKKAYDTALKDIERRIKELYADELTQSRIYQIEYQKALKSQVETIIDQMQSKHYDTIQAYLKDSYTDGFIGTMYDLQKQGIPVIMPIDQNQVAKAVVNDVKLSGDMYSAMGRYLKPLKRSVTQEISRGLASSKHWSAIGAAIERRCRVGLSNAQRVARTEGHRVQNQSAYDAQKAAKDSGADIVKQWDSTLDGNTRPHHRQLDGQLREYDEPFEIAGRKALYPGGFGVASEDINCRCVLLQRAKWALDEDELETLKERAAHFELDKSKDFEDFKAKYLKASEKVKQIEFDFSANALKLDVSGWPEPFKTKSAKKRLDKFTEIMNDVKGADQGIIELYNSFGKMRYFAHGGAAKVKFTEKNHFIQWKAQGLTVQIPKMEGNGLHGQANTFAHEVAHAMDAAISSSRFGMLSNDLAHKIPSLSVDEVPDWVKERSEELRKKRNDLWEEAARIYRESHSSLVDDYYAGKLSYDEYKKRYKVIKNDYENGTSRDLREMFDGWNAVEDIFDALTFGKAREDGVVNFGHGTEYYSRNVARIHEIWANYCALSVLKPELMDELRSELPEVIETMDELRDAMLEQVRNG